MATTLLEAMTGDYAGPAALPSYDRSAVTAGIVHLGVGGFHRSHQALYIDKLLSAGSGQEWGICGVGTLENDRHMRDVMAGQDNLFTVLEKSPDGSVQARVVGSMVEYLFLPDEPNAVLEKLASPDTRIVTLTITEGGYNLEPATREFESTNPLIVAEAAGEGSPRTHFRLLHEALRLRRERGLPPFVVATCDNIQGNGDVARHTLLAYLDLADPDFAGWVADNVHFPNSMVDRITPLTDDGDRNLARDEFGLIDGWPVPCESFTQWVLEDDFPLGRPPLEEAGVQFVNTVIPFEMMKLRLLNASHQVIGLFSALRGHTYVYEAISDPLVRNAVIRFQANEAEPTLLPVPGTDLTEYQATLIDRFSNPAVKDTIARLSSQTSTAIPNFVLPIVRDQLAAGRDITIGTALVAAWACHARDNSDQIVDRRRDLVIAQARDTENPYAFIEDAELFGDLSSNERFRDEFRRWRDTITDRGIADSLAQLGASSSS